MARRSPRKKNISPEPVVVESDDNEFMGVASDDHLEDDLDLQHADEDETGYLQSSKGKKETKLVHNYGSFVPFVQKNPTLTGGVQSDDEEIVITPPPTPTRVKSAGGKKRAVANGESDDDEVFIPSPTQDSPKKARAKQPSTPSKNLKSAPQVILDTAGSDRGKMVDKANTPFSSTSRIQFKVTAKASKARASKALSPTSEIKDATIYLADIEMRRVIVPELEKCQIHQPNLVDFLLKKTYKDLPKLPRMADYGPTFGDRSVDGGFQLSQILNCYGSLDVGYLTRLIAFDCDKAGNLGNLSRIDPSLLGIKDANTYSKNTLYLHGFSTPLLCFSLVLVTGDNHEYGRIMGSEPREWVAKDILGVLPSMELERLVAVLGLAYELPYIPEDSARREVDLLHFSMVENAFRFTTTMTGKAEFYKATSSKSTPNRTNKMFAPASPAFSSKPAIPASAARKPSLRASETVPIYDGRTRQLKIPNELRKIPDILPRYAGNIPEYSLALMAYTVSTYSAPDGPRKDELVANLHIHFAVVLHEPITVSKASDEASSDEEKELVNDSE